MSWEQLPGWFDYEDVYKDAVERAPNFATFVEIGVGFGRSIAYLASEAIRVTKKLQIYGVDPWNDDWDTDHPTWGANHAAAGRALGGPYNAVTALMHQHAPIEMEYVRLLRCRSVQAARMFEDESVFFVFIDGSHHHADVAEDLSEWERKIIPGGCFAGHDHTDGFPGVQQAVRERWTDGRTQQRGACWWRSY